jgi:hypothetical protein
MHRAFLPSSIGKLDVRRQLTDAIVRHGSLDGTIAMLQQSGFSGAEIAEGHEAAKAAARVILKLDAGLPDAAYLARHAALAATVATNPELTGAA